MAGASTYIIGPSGTVRQDDFSDIELMKQRMSKKAFEQSDDKGKPELHNKEISRLFVRNLAFSSTDKELADLFKPFGEISQVSLIMNRTFFSLVLDIVKSGLDQG